MQGVFQIELARFQAFDDLVQPFEARFEAREALARFRGCVRSCSFRAGHGRGSALSVLASAASLSSKGPRGSAGSSKTPSGSANAGSERPLAVTTRAPRTAAVRRFVPGAGAAPVAGPNTS